MKNVSGRNCIEIQNTYFIINNFFLRWGGGANEIMWKNVVEQGWPQMIIWSMYWQLCATIVEVGKQSNEYYTACVCICSLRYTACWVPEAINTGLLKMIVEVLTTCHTQYT
jgi:hypothetical protein